MKALRSIVLGVLSSVALLQVTFAVNDCTTTVVGQSSGYAISCADGGCASTPGKSCQSTPTTVVVNGQTRNANVCVCSPGGSPGVCCQAYQLKDSAGNVSGRAISGKCSKQDQDCPYGTTCGFGTYGDPDQDRGRCSGKIAQPPH